MPPGLWHRDAGLQVSPKSRSVLVVRLLLVEETELRRPIARSMLGRAALFHHRGGVFADLFRRVDELPAAGVSCRHGLELGCTALLQRSDERRVGNEEGR